MRSAQVMARTLPPTWKPGLAPRLAFDSTIDSTMPRTRDGLLVNDLRDETLVFNSATLRAHCLSATTSLVFRYCDGRTPCREVARRLTEDHACDDAWELLWLILDALAARRLVARLAVTIDGDARREFLRRTTQLAAWLPLISSVAAPSPPRTAVTCGVSR